MIKEILPINSREIFSEILPFFLCSVELVANTFYTKQPHVLLCIIDTRSKFNELVKGRILFFLGLRELNQLLINQSTAEKKRFHLRISQTV